MFIYKITNKINGKAYIGLTTETVAKRWKRHQERAREGVKMAICHAINKYGVDNFDVCEITRASDVEELKALEMKYIEEFDTLCPNGYNLTKGGDFPSEYNMSKGEDRPLAKLDEFTVKWARRPEFRKLSSQYLCNLLSEISSIRVSKCTMQLARVGKTWAYLNDKYPPLRAGATYNANYKMFGEEIAQSLDKVLEAKRLIVGLLRDRSREAIPTSIFVRHFKDTFGFVIGYREAARIREGRMWLAFNEEFPPVKAGLGQRNYVGKRAMKWSI